MKSLEELLAGNVPQPLEIVACVEEWLNVLREAHIITQNQANEISSYARVRTQRDRTVRNLQDHGTCWECDGVGKISDGKFPPVAINCPDCKGTGRNP